jgi:hypothetical protein
MLKRMIVERLVEKSACLAKAQREMQRWTKLTGLLNGFSKKGKMADAQSSKYKKIESKSIIFGDFQGKYKTNSYSFQR